MRVLTLVLNLFGLVTAVGALEVGVDNWSTGIHSNRYLGLINDSGLEWYVSLIGQNGSVWESRFIATAGGEPATIEDDDASMITIALTGMLAGNLYAFTYDPDGEFYFAGERVGDLVESSPGVYSSDVDAQVEAFDLATFTAGQMSTSSWLYYVVVGAGLSVFFVCIIIALMRRGVGAGCARG